MRLLRLCMAWVAGVYAGSLAPVPAAVPAGLAVFWLGVAVLWRPGRRRMGAGLCLALLAAGTAWYQVKVSPPALQEYSGQSVVVEGRVESGSVSSEGGAWLVFGVERVLADDWSRPVSGRLVLYTGPSAAYSEGDVLRVSGLIRPLSDVRSDGYRQFLEGQGFAGTMGDSARIELLRRSWLFGFRDRLSLSLRRALAEPQASLAEGLLLGLRSHLPEELKSDFVKTGTSHLLAISGFNLALIGGAVLAAAARVLGRQRPLYLAVTLLMVWMYSALTGMQPPVLRAAMMFSLMLAGLWLGRPGSALTSLALAGAVMAGLDPPVLWDVSFRLSFASVAGLVVLQPPLLRWSERVVPEGHWLAWMARPIFVSLAGGLAAILASLPLVAYHFGSLSLVGLPATVAASVFVSAATMTSGVTALLGLLWAPAAGAAGFVASFFLMCMVGVVEVFARLPLASVETGAAPAAAVWAYYLLPVAVLRRRQMGAAAARALAAGRVALERASELAWRLPRKRTAGVLALGACLVWAGFASVPGTRLQVSFLDVGQGDAILIITPAGQQILIDGGPDPDRVCQRLGQELPFWDKSLDLVVLTHCHDDHLAGLMGVLQRYGVDQVLESGSGAGPLYRGWHLELVERSIERTTARAGQQIDLGEGIVLEVLHPSDEPVEGTGPEANSSSLVLRLVWNEVSFLLAGDADVEAEKEMLYGGMVRDLRSDVLKVGHHGSSLSTSPAFLAAVDPQVAVISVGAGNTFGHPGEETLAALDGLDLYRTDQHGTVTLTTDGQRLWVTAARAAAVPGGQA